MLLANAGARPCARITLRNQKGPCDLDHAGVVDYNRAVEWMGPRRHALLEYGNNAVMCR